MLGGHLIEGCTIFGFAEIILMELRDIEMEKNYDEETRTLQPLYETVKPEDAPFI